MPGETIIKANATVKDNLLSVFAELYFPTESLPNRDTIKDLFVKAIEAKKPFYFKYLYRQHLIDKSSEIEVNRETQSLSAWAYELEGLEEGTIKPLFAQAIKARKPIVFLYLCALDLIPEYRPIKVGEETKLLSDWAKVLKVQNFYSVLNLFRSNYRLEFRTHAKKLYESITGKNDHPAPIKKIKATGPGEPVAFDPPGTFLEQTIKGLTRWIASDITRHVSPAGPETPLVAFEEFLALEGIDLAPDTTPTQARTRFADAILSDTSITERNCLPAIMGLVAGGIEPLSKFGPEMTAQSLLCKAYNLTDGPSVFFELARSSDVTRDTDVVADTTVRDAMAEFGLTELFEFVKSPKPPGWVKAIGKEDALFSMFDAMTSKRGSDGSGVWELAGETVTPETLITYAKQLIILGANLEDRQFDTGPGGISVSLRAKNYRLLEIMMPVSVNLFLQRERQFFEFLKARGVLKPLINPTPELATLVLGAVLMGDERCRPLHIEMLFEKGAKVRPEHVEAVYTKKLRKTFLLLARALPREHDAKYIGKQFTLSDLASHLGVDFLCEELRGGEPAKWATDAVSQEGSLLFSITQWFNAAISDADDGEVDRITNQAVAAFMRLQPILKESTGATVPLRGGSDALESKIEQSGEIGTTKSKAQKRVAMIMSYHGAYMEFQRPHRSEGYIQTKHNDEYGKLLTYVIGRDDNEDELVEVIKLIINNLLEIKTAKAKARGERLNPRSVRKILKKAIEAALKNGKVEVFQYLISQELQGQLNTFAGTTTSPLAEIKLDGGQSIPQAAAECGWLEDVESVLEKFPELSFNVDDDGENILHSLMKRMAAAFGDGLVSGTDESDLVAVANQIRKLAEVAIRNGADPSQKSSGPEGLYPDECLKTFPQPVGGSAYNAVKALRDYLREQRFLFSEAKRLGRVKFDKKTGKPTYPIYENQERIEYTPKKAVKFYDLLQRAKNASLIPKIIGKVAGRKAEINGYRFFYRRALRDERIGVLSTFGSALRAKECNVVTAVESAKEANSRLNADPNLPSAGPILRLFGQLRRNNQGRTTAFFANKTNFQLEPLDFEAGRASLS